MARYGAEGRLARLVALLPGRWQRRVAPHAERLLQGLSSLRSPGASLLAVLLSIVLLAVAALTNYLLFRAFGLELSFVAALFLLVLLQVGSVPPSLPGKIGVFNYVVVVGLSALGVDRFLAFSYSVALYAVALLPKVVLGVAYLALGSRGWSASLAGLRAAAASEMRQA
jgi:hypothetical protein